MGGFREDLAIELSHQVDGEERAKQKAECTKMWSRESAWQMTALFVFVCLLCPVLWSGSVASKSRNSSEFRGFRIY